MERGINMKEINITKDEKNVGYDDSLIKFDGLYFGNWFYTWTFC